MKKGLVTTNEGERTPWEVERGRSPATQRNLRQLDQYFLTKEGKCGHYCFSLHRLHSIVVPSDHIKQVHFRKENPLAGNYTVDRQGKKGTWTLLDVFSVVCTATEARPGLEYTGIVGVHPWIGYFTSLGLLILF